MPSSTKARQCGCIIVLLLIFTILPLPAQALTVENVTFADSSHHRRYCLTAPQCGPAALSESYKNLRGGPLSA